MWRLAGQNDSGPCFVLSSVAHFTCWHVRRRGGEADRLELGSGQTRRRTEAVTSVVVLLDTGVYRVTVRQLRWRLVQKRGDAGADKE